MQREKATTPNFSREHILLKNDFVYFEEVSFSYNKKDFALKDISLNITFGDFIFITGKSGSGKTSLLKLITKELEAQRGQIIFSKKEDAIIGQIFQDLRYLDDWTLLDNLRFSYDPLLYSTELDFLSELKKISLWFGAYEHLNKKLSECNGGLIQKMAIIRCLLKRPDVVVADEPTSSLDRENTFLLYDFLKKKNQESRMTIIWATHSQDLVRNFSEKNIHLENGRTKYIGKACFI